MAHPHNWNGLGVELSILMTKDDSVLGHRWSSLELDRSAGSETGLNTPDVLTDAVVDRLAPQPSFRSKGSRGLTKLRSLNPFKVATDRYCSKALLW